MRSLQAARPNPGVVHTMSGQSLAPGTKQTLLTDHMDRLPPHVLQQMYAGKSGQALGAGLKANIKFDKYICRVPTQVLKVLKRS